MLPDRYSSATVYLFAALARAQRRGVLLLVLLVFCVFLNLAAGNAAASQQHLQTQIASGEQVSAAAADRSYERVRSYGMVQVGLFLVTGFVWLLWLHSSYELLRHLGTKVTRFSPGQAVGAWFVPFVNLVRPYQVVSELRLRTRNLNATAEPQPLTSGEITALWWLTWLAANVTELLYAAFLGTAKTADVIVVADKIGFAGNALEAAAALLAYYLVRQIHNAQKLAAVPAAATPAVA
ncbi:MAG TPA: DUF4328 domain-containing protein [Thermoanaerobaculia bacterium]|nr:DUF4328 domain-containing protein [Thermoanaerobaculia bacterium]